ncbi:hypothetical protein KY329_04200 [Candidatus Woesearchaeota archaeon]|nr:hypothetical protein [Candidatus Woesearchaeota archaeon]
MEQVHSFRNIDDLLYWTILILSIVGNFLISIVLVPFLVALQGWLLYITVFGIAATFGYMFTFILRSIEQLHPRQKVLAKLLIPAIALINVTIITLLSNRLILLLQVATEFHNPLIVGITYVVGYSLPSIRKKKI